MGGYFSFFLEPTSLASYLRLQRHAPSVISSMRRCPLFISELYCSPIRSDLHKPKPRYLLMFPSTAPSWPGTFTQDIIEEEKKSLLSSDWFRSGSRSTTQCAFHHQLLAGFRCAGDEREATRSRKHSTASILLPLLLRLLLTVFLPHFRLPHQLQRFRQSTSTTARTNTLLAILAFSFSRRIPCARTLDVPG